jgi:hypothetical protein
MTEIATPKRASLRALFSNLNIWHAALIYSAAAVVVTFPTILKMNTALFGYATDAPYYLWLTWWRRYSFVHGLSYNFQPLMQAPFGAQQVVPGFSGLMIPMTLLSFAIGEVAAYNIMIMLAYALSGWLAFLVVRRFVHKPWLAVIGGFLFMLSPYAMANTQHHVDLAQQWVIPLFVLALMRLSDHPTVSSALMLGGAFALANYFNPYYGYHVVIMALTFGIVESIYLTRNQGWRAIFSARRVLLYGLAAIVGGLLFAPELIAIARSAYGARDPLHPFNQLAQPKEWFFYGSSRPWDFFLPPIFHPLLGSVSQKVYVMLAGLHRFDFRMPFFRKQGILLDAFWFWLSHESAQETMYLGFANLVAAGYGIYAWRNRKLPIPDTDQKNSRNLWLTYFLVLACVAVLFTLPPYLPIGALLRHIWLPLHNLAIPMPSLFTMQFLAPLRGVIRIMPVIVLCLVVWVGVGLDAFIANYQLAAQRTAIAAFVLIAGFEYLRLPVVTDYAAPAYVDWLAYQPAGTVTAIYPFDAEDPIFQYIHEQPMVNTISRPGTPADTLVLTEQSSIGSLIDGVPARLAALGVDKVIITDQSSAAPDGLHEVDRVGHARIYEITAEPIALAVLYTPSGTLWKSDSDWSWQGASKQLYIWNTYPVATSIRLHLAGNIPNSIQLQRILTPLDENVILYGIRQPNPLRSDPYPPEVLKLQVDGDGNTESFEVSVGETILTLRLPEGLANISSIDLIVSHP